MAEKKSIPTKKIKKAVKISAVASMDPDSQIKILPGEIIKNVPMYIESDRVILTGIPTPLELTDEEKLLAAQQAESDNKPIFVTTKIDSGKKSTSVKNLSPFGVVCKLVNILDLPNGKRTALVLPVYRAYMVKIDSRRPYYTATIDVCDKMEIDMDNYHHSTTFAMLQDYYNDIIEFLNDEERDEVKFNLEQYNSLPVDKLNFMIMHSPISKQDTLELISINKVDELMERVLKMFDIERQKLEYRDKLRMQTHERLTAQQKEAFLNEHIRTMQSELGIEGNSEIDDLLSKSRGKKAWTDDLHQHFEKEVNKLSRLNPMSPDYSVQYNYLESFLNLPWNEKSDLPEISIAKVREQLDADHYGLEKVKERILEYVAVLKLRGDMKAPILCLYGPPGVGKTSLGKSVAAALGRKYARISLGGVHDEAEIRGHRRTYIAALPGRILATLQKVGVCDPVLMLDEIDKIGKDYKGDPSQALLEVLDPEQNSTFHDNFINYDFDLSNIFFIATANDLSTISAPLLDRMEIIEVPGYAVEEKIEIGKRHLLPEVLEELGMQTSNIKLTNEAMQYLIEHYTRESGVRQLKKELSALMRKIAVRVAEDKEVAEVIDVVTLKELLGREKVNPDTYEGNDISGVVTGLAWTQVGGEILFVETSLSKGKGEKLTLTGNLGDVMKESAQIALQWLKANGEKFGITHDMLTTQDIHIHVPEGAVPKDGPSAGVTMVTSIASAFTGRKVKKGLAMTGEISLRGKVLPVGGIKEKILAAKRAGITEVLLCEDNRKDIEEIDTRYLGDMKFHFVKRIEEVLDYALI